METTEFLFEVRLDALQEYLVENAGLTDVSKMALSAHEGSGKCVDWHLVLRSGLNSRLHINLGIPGIEEPEDPIEENGAALYAAMVMGLETLQVIFSGELELAVEAGLIADSALENLRNKIRVSS